MPQEDRKTDLKYELVEEASNELLRAPALESLIRYRPRALRDIPEHGIAAGDLGGKIAGEHNLSQSGASWITFQAEVSGNARVEDDALVSGRAKLQQYAIARDRAVVTDRAGLYQRAIASGSSHVGGSTMLSGDIELTNNVRSDGHAAIIVSPESNLDSLPSVITTQDQLPWRFNVHDHKSDGFLDRLRTALDQDRRFQSWFRAIGATDHQQAHQMLDALWSMPSARGRQALSDAARMMGGAFLNGEYGPARPSDLLSQQRWRHELGDADSGYRVLASIRDSESVFIHPASGAPLYAAVVEAHIPDAHGKDQTYYQPAILSENEPPEYPTMFPDVGEVYTLPGSYLRPGEAERAVQDFFRYSLVIDIDPRHALHNGFPLTRDDLEALPLIWDQTQLDAALVRTQQRQELTVTTYIGPWNDVADDALSPDAMRQSGYHAEVRPTVPLAGAIDHREGMHPIPQPSVETARIAAVTHYEADRVTHIREEIAERDAGLAHYSCLIVEAERKRDSGGSIKHFEMRVTAISERISVLPHLDGAAAATPLDQPDAPHVPVLLSDTLEPDPLAPEHDPKALVAAAFAPVRENIIGAPFRAGWMTIPNDGAPSSLLLDDIEHATADSALSAALDALKSHLGEVADMEADNDLGMISIRVHVETEELVQAEEAQLQDAEAEPDDASETPPFSLAEATVKHTASKDVTALPEVDEDIAEDNEPEAPPFSLANMAAHNEETENTRKIEDAVFEEITEEEERATTKRARQTISLTAIMQRQEKAIEEEETARLTYDDDEPDFDDHPDLGISNSDGAAPGSRGTSYPNATQTPSGGVAPNKQIGPHNPFAMPTQVAIRYTITGPEGSPPTRTMQERPPRGPAFLNREAHVSPLKLYDSGDHLRSDHASKQMVKDIVRIAAHRNWDKIEIQGSPQVIREAMIEAAKHGIEIITDDPGHREIEVKPVEATPTPEPAQQRRAGASL